MLLQTYSRIKFSQKSLRTFSALSQNNLNIVSPDKVLSKVNRENCMQLLNSLRDIKFFKSRSLKKAAVLVPLCHINSKLGFLYTERAFHLKVNAGEIAFPGGMFDESDITFEKTALREAHEEIGLSPNKVDLWGKGPEIHQPHVIVTPVLGYIGQLKLRHLKLNPSEVNSVFAVTLDNLSSSESFRVTRFRAGETSVFMSPVYLGGEKRIWGLTALITHIILSSLIPDVYKKSINFLPGIQTVVHYKKKLNIVIRNAEK